MGSDLYRVSVLEIETNKVRLSVKAINPDDDFVPKDPSFALMLLREAAKDRDPLGEAISFESLIDEDWQYRYARGFIKKLTVSRVKDEPAAEVEITVTHPGWLAHLRSSSKWASRAFQVAEAYGRCKPVTPDAPTAASEVKATTGDAGGIMLVPNPSEHPTKDLPFIEMPVYDARAYDAVDVRTGAAIKPALEEWVGRAIYFEAYNKKMVGGLVRSGRQHIAHTIFNGGSTSWPVDDAKRVGLCALKPKARLGSPLTYETAFNGKPTRVLSATVDGKTAVLTFELTPDGRKPRIESASDVLYLLRDVKKKTKLDVALKRDEKSKDPKVRWPTEVCSVFAGGYIADWKLDMPKLPSLDGADLATARAALCRPPPTARLTVTATDPAWVEHLGTLKARDMPAEEFVQAAPKPWSGNPRTFEG
jgi:hypothetical protein